MSGRPREREGGWPVPGQHLILSRSLPEAAAILAAFNAGLKTLKDGGAIEEFLRRHPSAAP
ncbi:hypothetical protein [Azospirillum himalayense]|uniref:Uncharacterized protein n=1 Tax=Azospirillum himalayense TaxID=654847 RepID=A0ABW0G6Q9_9PROT